MSLTLAAIAPEHRDDLALADERVAYSWNELDPVINRAANALSALPFPGERRVAVFAQNAAEAVVAYVACIEAGISSVPVSFHLTPAEAAYILKDSGAVAVLVGPETMEAGLAAAAEAGIATVIGWRCPPRDGLIDWDGWIGDKTVHAHAPGVGLDLTFPIKSAQAAILPLAF